MKEHPILFSTDMVHALLDGRKTQTRRIINPQPDDNGLHNHSARKMALDSELEGWYGTVEETGENKQFKCRQGTAGDKLWVRETFYKAETCIDNGVNHYFYIYKASNKSDFMGPWKPCIFMKKEAARIWLEVINVRVERLQDISVEDAIAAKQAAAY